MAQESCRTTVQKTGGYRAAACLVVAAVVTAVSAAPAQAAPQNLLSQGTPQLQPLKLFLQRGNPVVQYGCPRLGRPRDREGLEEAGAVPVKVEVTLTTVEKFAVPGRGRIYFPLATETLINKPRTPPQLYDCWDGMAWGTGFLYGVGQGLGDLPIGSTRVSRFLDLPEQRSTPQLARLLKRMDGYIKRTRRVRVQIVSYRSGGNEPVIGRRQTVVSLASTPPVNCRLKALSNAPTSQDQNDIGAVLYLDPDERDIGTCTVRSNPALIGPGGEVISSWQGNESVTIVWRVNGQIVKQEPPRALAFSESDDDGFARSPIEQAEMVTKLPVGRESRIEMQATSSNGTSVTRVWRANPVYLR